MRPENLVEMLSGTVRKFPKKDAFLWKEPGDETFRKMTYETFWEKIHRAASAFVQLGIRPGDKVAIISGNNPYWAITDFALASIRAVSVPVYPTLPAGQTRTILENGDVRAAIVENEKQLRKVLNSGIGLDFAVTIYPEKNFGSDGKNWDFERFEELGGSHLLMDWESLWSPISRNELVTIIHTSGTTGKPNGAMLTHGNFLANIEAVQFWLIEIVPEDLALSYLPLSHVFERMAGHYTLLSVGTTIAYAEGIDKLPENLKEIRPTIMTSVPRFFEKVYGKVMEQIERGSPIRKKVFNWAVGVGIERYERYLEARIDELILGRGLPKSLERKWKVADRLVFQKVKRELGGRLRGMVSGGGALNRDIAQFFWAMDLPILEGYGLTETAPVISANPMVRAKVGTVGKILPNLEVKLAEDNEILVRGPSVMIGYYKDVEATNQAFEDGWFKTGDIGVLDEEGYLKIIDRKKRILVLSTGKNVAPQPIENAISESRYIEYTLVVGDGRKFVVALVKPDFEELYRWVKKKGLRAAYADEMILLDEVKALFKKEIEARIQGFSDFEKPKKIILVKDEWSVEKGELTPKLSLRLNEIEKKYRDFIERAYSEESGGKERELKILTA
jgi:AMP-binding enzyme.